MHLSLLLEVGQIPGRAALHVARLPVGIGSDVGDGVREYVDRGDILGPDGPCLLGDHDLRSDEAPEQRSGRLFLERRAQRCQLFLDRGIRSYLCRHQRQQQQLCDECKSGDGHWRLGRLKASTVVYLAVAVRVPVLLKPTRALKNSN